MGLAVALLFLAAIIFISKHVEAPTVGNTVSSKPKTSDCNGLLVQENCYVLEQADTPQKQIKGLSDRDSLPARTGMLFVFDGSEQRCMWMKDMHFNLDIIWLDQTKKIIKIEQNLSPATYPNTFCADNTTYVIELNSGDAATLQLAIGDQLTF